MKRLAGPLLAVAVVLSGCGGTDENLPSPLCDLTNGSSVLLMAQAVPDAVLVPCVDTLPPGWTVSSVSVRRGFASFTLDAEDLGDPFLHVQHEEACPARVGEEQLVVPGAVANRAREVRLIGPEQSTVAIVPESGDNVVAANSLAVELLRMGVDASIVPVGGELETRLDAALAAGAATVLVDDLTSAENVAVLTDPASGRQTTHDVDDLVNTLGGFVAGTGETTYRGGWYYRFEGGCTTLRFDAAGPAANTVADEVERAISFISRPTLDRFTQANLGLRLDPDPG